MSSEMVAVVQADRNFAADYGIRFGRFGELYRRAIEDGKWDHTDDVQLVARHRQQAEARATSGAGVPDGMRLVPVEPTPEILIAMGRSADDFFSKPGPYPRSRAVYAAMLAAVPASPTEAPGSHADDCAVDLFAAKMKAKLSRAREKGRGGWDDPAQCSPEKLSAMLHEHVAKGDSVDVANFAMMIEHYGASITAAEAPGSEGAGEALREALEWALAEIDGRTVYRDHPPYTAKDQQDNAYNAAQAALKGSSYSGDRGWIVGNNVGQWRTFDTFGWAWTNRRDLAVRYARREDAELVHGEDEDSWRVEQYPTRLALNEQGEG